MRWTKKHHRIVKRFAFIPIGFRDDYRWLEMVYIKQRRGCMIDSWFDESFATKEEYKEWRRECREKKMQSKA